VNEEEGKGEALYFLKTIMEASLMNRKGVEK
jgi:hypothetical protein